MMALDAESVLNLRDAQQQAGGVGAGVEARAATDQVPHQGVEGSGDEHGTPAELYADRSVVRHHVGEPQSSDIVERLDEQR
jgi:hypothetical protein